MQDSLGFKKKTTTNLLSIDVLDLRYCSLGLDVISRRWPDLGVKFSLDTRSHCLGHLGKKGVFPLVGDFCSGVEGLS